MFCEIITTGFRSSLVSHLTVQSKTQPIDSFEEMVALDGWRWGTEETLYKGAPVEYFTISQDPVVKKTNSIMEVRVCVLATEEVESGSSLSQKDTSNTKEKETERRGIKHEGNREGNS